MEKMFKSQDIINKFKSSNVVVLRTDTVYGLVVVANDPEAVRKLYEAKGREGKPGTIIAANVNQLVNLGLDEYQLKQANKYWPGPNSIIVKASKELEYLHLGLDSLAVRIPDNKKLIELLLQSGPLATTSANLPGQPVAKDITEAKQIFGKKVSLYVNGGFVDNPTPSNIYILDPNGSYNKIR